MQVLSSSVSQVAAVVSQGGGTDGAQLMVLKKALDVQAGAAAALIQALPQPPGPLPLATDGNLGTLVNTLA
jgi:Putative motility protein